MMLSLLRLFHIATAFMSPQGLWNLLLFGVSMSSNVTPGSWLSGYSSVAMRLSTCSTVLDHLSSGLSGHSFVGLASRTSLIGRFQLFQRRLVG